MLAFCVVLVNQKETLYAGYLYPSSVDQLVCRGIPPLEGAASRRQKRSEEEDPLLEILVSSLGVINKSDVGYPRCCRHLSACIWKGGGGECDER